MVAGLLGETTMGLVDTKLVGGLGGAAIGGVGVALIIMFLANALINGTMRGVKIQTAHAVGEERPDTARDFMVGGVLFGLVAGLLLCIPGGNMGWMFRALGLHDDLVVTGRDFFAAVVLGAPAFGVQSALIQYRQGLSDSRTPAVVQLSGNVVNAVLAYTLVYGHFGFRAYGVAGAGYATAAALWFNAVVLSALFLRSPSSWSSVGSAIRKVVALGLPTGFHYAFETLAMLAFTVLIAGIGPNEIAGHQIAIMILRASFLPGLAIGEAATVLVARSLGAGEHLEARRATRSALRLAIGFMLCCGVVFAALGKQLVVFFTPDVDVQRVAVHVLWVAALFQVPDAVNIVLQGALRGAKDTSVPAQVEIAAIWLFVPPSAYVLGNLVGWGAVGGWVGFLLEATVAASILARRYRRAYWQNFNAT